MRLDLPEIGRLLDEGRYWTEYQALVHARSGRTAAFEALARFVRADGRRLAPARVFALLHRGPELLARTELALKLQQVQHAPRAPLFVNMAPASWPGAAPGRRDPFLALFASAGVPVVVEVTEALAVADAHLARRLASALRTRRIDFALDDVGAANGLVSYEALADAAVVKLDRSVLARLRTPRWLAMARAIVRMARDNGARTVLEGVETTADYARARELGVDLVQGHLFRERARTAGR